MLFDLFDTLVDLDMQNLPAVEIRGQRFHSTHRALHEVIVQRVDLDFESFADALRAVDRELRSRAYTEGRELPTIERFGALARRLDLDDPELAGELTAVHMQGIFESARFLSHHVDVLKELSAGRQLGVCSNFSHTPTAQRVLEAARLHESLAAVVISEGVGYRKPRAEIFEAALAELGVPAEQTVHVGDNLDADVDGATRVGMRTVWITRRVSDAQAALRAHAGAEPTWIVEDLAEVPALIR